MDKTTVALLTSASLVSFAAGTMTPTLRAAVPVERFIAVSIDVPFGTPILGQILDSAAGATCAEAESQAGLDEGDCTKDDIQKIVIRRGETSALVSVGYSFDGSWVKGSPE